MTPTQPQDGPNEDKLRSYLALKDFVTVMQNVDLGDAIQKIKQWRETCKEKYKIITQCIAKMPIAEVKKG